MRDKEIERNYEIGKVVGGKGERFNERVHIYSISLIFPCWGPKVKWQHISEAIESVHVLPYAM